ncbi:MAG TPA: glutamine--tRNA ligase/YqeY domain fusion protein [Alcanivoracaceae bacterium]|nr:glutamine--tRNA ligase/YqeY domain fusion protein [Alcanivoracaceae bacterium]
MTERVDTPTNFIRQIIDRDLADGKHTKIITRFPPEPNGYLHVGHAKSICLNFGIARDYEGDCHLRFDDTNPSNESVEYVESIKDNVEWLGGKWDGPVRFASDYFDELYECAIKLIKAGLAYVDNSTPEEIAEYRGNFTTPGRNSPYRERDVEENLALFEKMRAGEYEQGEAVLRAKIDMASPNMNLRDPILYRVLKESHHQTGDKWCIYPMYDYTHPISDAIEGITHSLCTLEFEAHRPLYDWVLDSLEGLHEFPSRPRQIEFARLNLNYTVTSKRRLKLLVDEGHVTGWDDPRMPTISGLRRRGYTPASIRRFCDMIGVARADSVVDVSMLESAVRDDLNKNAPRAMCVLDPVKVVITNWPEGKEETLTAPVHPQNEALGTREVPMSGELWIDRADFKEEANRRYKRLVLDGAVRLRSGYVITATSVDKNEQGEIETIYCTYDPDTLGTNPEGYKPRGVIHWVSAAHAKDAEVRLYDRIFLAENPDRAEGGMMGSLNPESLVVRQGCKIEPSAVQGEARNFQFEREGYFCHDTDSTAEQPVFNLTVSLRESFN